jgi:CubicO group peptidase (beta-lactamase class C family)
MAGVHDGSPDAATTAGPSFPPRPDERWTLDTWREPPLNRRSYQHMREIVPTARVAAKGAASALRLGNAVPLDRVDVTHPDGREETAAAVLARTFTDGFLVLSGDEIVVETYPGGMPADRPHMLLSLSKSVVGCVVASLAEAGLVDVDGLLTVHLPELLASGYAGATVRNLLDMRSGIAYSED